MGSRPLEKNENTAMMDQDTIVIEANAFVKHDGYLHRISTLFRILHYHRQTLSRAKLCFNFPDGEPISFTALDRVLEIICQNHGLEADRVICRMVDHYPLFQSQWCSVQTFPTPFFQQAANLLRSDLCIMEHDAKLFGAAYGRFTPHRLLMAYFLSSHFANDLFLIFQPGQDFVEFEMDPGHDLFRAAIEWAANRPLNQDNLVCQFNGCVSSFECLPVYHDIFGKYRIEVVIETNTHSQGWFTEKTAKCLASGKPFLLYGAPGQLQQLQKMGFQTFRHFIDESYDTVQDPDIRFDNVCDTALAIGRDPRRSLLLEEIDNIAKWNKKNYKRIIQDYYHDLSH